MVKLPKEIYGWNKIRDAQICLLWASEDVPTEELAERFKLSQRRIEQILKVNHLLIPIDKEWEKRKRIHRLNLEVKNKPKSAKDVADLLEQLRKEIEGDKPLVDNSSHHTLVLQIEKANDEEIKIARKTVASIQ